MRFRCPVTYEVRSIWGDREILLPVNANDARELGEIAWYMTEDAQGTRPHATDTWGAQPFKRKIYASDGNSGLWIVDLKPPSRQLVP